MNWGWNEEYSLSPEVGILPDGDALAALLPKPGARDALLISDPLCLKAFLIKVLGQLEEITKIGMEEL